MKYLLPAIILAGASCVAFADEVKKPAANERERNIYAGFTLGGTTYKEEGFSAFEPSFVTAGWRLGARFNEYISGEIRYQRGLVEDTGRVSGVNLEAELDYIAGAYLKVGAGDKFHPYAMLGYNKVSMEVTGSAGGASLTASDSESDVAFGLGVDLFVTDRFSLSAECANFYDKDGGDFTGCFAGAGVWF